MIHVDSKTRFFPMGYVASYCPLCRDVIALQVYRSNTVVRVMLIPIDGGQNTGYVGDCCECNNRYSLDKALAERCLPQVGNDFPAFVNSTNPEMPENLELLFRALQSIRQRRGNLPPEQRYALILDPFEVVCGQFHRRDPADWIRITGCVLVVCLSVIVPIFAVSASLLTQWFEYQTAWILGSVSFVFGILAAWLSFQIATHFGTHQRIRQLVTAALVEIKPTREELKSVLTDLQNRRVAEAKLFTPDSLFEAIAQMESQHPRDGPGTTKSSPNYEALLSFLARPKSKTTVAAQPLSNPVPLTNASGTAMPDLGTHWDEDT